MSGRVYDPEVLMPSEIAKILGVKLATVRRWSADGKLPCTKTDGGHRRYRRADVEALRLALERVPEAGGPDAES